MFFDLSSSSAIMDFDYQKFLKLRMLMLGSLYQIRIILLGYRKCFWSKGKIIDWE